MPFAILLKGTWASDSTVAVPIGEGARTLPRWTNDLPDALRDCLAAALAADGFEGKSGQTAVVYSADGTGILYGTGTGRSAEAQANAVASMITAASKAKLTKVSVPLPAGKDARAAAEAAVIGARLGMAPGTVYAHLHAIRALVPST